MIATPSGDPTLLSTFGAMLRISLRRSWADWPIVVAAGLICLLAATLLAAGAIYANAVATAGLHRVLADSPVTEANIAVGVRVAPAEADALDAAVGAELDRAFGLAGGEVVRIARSGTFALPGQPPGAIRDLAVLGSMDRLEQHASLLAGDWPEDGVGEAGRIEVAVSETAAEALDLEIGERLELESRVEPGLAAVVEIGAIFRIDDPGSDYWWGEAQVLDGVVRSERFVTHGPFFTTRAALLSRATSSQLELGWRALPAIDRLTLGEAGALRARVGELDGRLEAAVGRPVTVTTELPAILAETERSLLVSRTGVLLLTIQLVVLAAYAVLLSAALLIEHRRVGTAMLRSRGAGVARIVALAAVEGLLLTVPAAVAGPWIASAALRAFNLTGPLAEIGLTIDPIVTVDAYLAAGAAAMVCLAALTLPTLGTARSSSVQRQVGRGQTANLGQRLGLDIALVAVAGVGLWQLRHYGAPLTRSVQGTLGLDPLLVATPAIGLLAGAIVALRLVPLVAQLIERATARGRGLVPSLGARQLARRPLRYTRAALLLMLAMALGVFAVSYTWTWSASQRDQATFQVGADLRVQPGSGHDSMPRWALDRAYAGLPGVAERLPVDRESIRPSGSSRTGQLLGLDAVEGASVVHLRPDLTSASLSELMAPLAAARPLVDAVRLPGEPSQLRIDVELELRRLERLEFDESANAPVAVEAELAEIGGSPGLGLAVVIRDARGSLYRIAGPTEPIERGRHRLVVPLAPGRAESGPGPSFAFPVDLFAVELSVDLAEGYQIADATIGVQNLATASGDGAWRPVSLDLAAGWRSSVAFHGAPHRAVDPDLRGDRLLATVGEPALQTLPGVDRDGRGTVLAFAPAAIGTVAADPVPIIANDALLEATSRQVGDILPLTLDGVRRDLLVTGALRAIPTTDPSDPAAMIDLATLVLLRYDGSAAVEPTDEWWLTVEDGASAAVAAALADPPIASRAVLSRAERGRALSTDPVALGIIGALGIGFVAAALFAIVGFMVSASVSARERIGEFALLRALGLSPNQLAVWLSLENATLAAVSLAAGTGLGLAIGWVVLPFITVTQGAATPFPPVAVEVPWTTVAVLAALAIVALTLTVIVLAWLLRRIGLASVLRMSED